MTDHLTETLVKAFAGRPVIPRAEAAELIGLTDRTLADVVKRGEIKVSTVGKKTQAFTLDALRAYLKEGQQCPSTGAKTRKRRGGGSASRPKVGGFMNQREQRQSGKPKQLSVIEGGK